MKIVEKNKLLLVLTFMAFTSINVFSQNVSFTAAAPNVVAVGEQFRVTYTLNAKGSEFKEPAFENFRVLTGPNISTSSSVQIVNGSMSQSTTYSYSYVVMAVTEGKFTIPAAGVDVKDKTYQSNTLTIEVVQGRQQQQQSASGSNNGGAASNVDNANIKDKSLFVAVNTDRKILYQGESLNAEIKVYTQKSLSGFEDIKLPPFTGFWSQDIEAPQQIELQRENVNGQIYEAGLFKKVLLFPQRSGEIEIDPFEITMITQERVKSNSPFDDFFGGSYRRVPYKLASKPVTITVKPLPSGAPADFDGAVGQFTMNAKVDKTSVKANEAVTLNIVVAGNGNLKLIKPLKVDFPPDIDVYDPKTSVNTKVSVSGISGNITFDYLFIPRYAGTFRIAPIKFSYFDTSTKTYKTIASNEFVIHVEKGSGDAEMTSGVVQGLTKEDVKLIGQDVRFLKTNFELKKKEKVLFNSALFYFYYIFSLILFAALIIGRRAQIKQNANQARVKNRKANKVSNKRLKKAAGYMKENQSELFYDEVLKAIWGYLSDKLVIPVAKLSKDNVSAILEQHKVDKETTESLMQLLNSCEFARYAPAAVTGGMDDIYTQAVSVISKLDQNIK